ncbi:unnamed protein product, partial [Effrenium voratum]
EIADVVRMSEATLLCRVRELKETPMAILSREEFEKAKPEALLGEEQQALPPCFKASQVAMKSSAQAALPPAPSLQALEDLACGQELPEASYAALGHVWAGVKSNASVERCSDAAPSSAKQEEAASFRGRSSR